MGAYGLRQLPLLLAPHSPLNRSVAPWTQVKEQESSVLLC